jgi:hypothetical protein
LTVALDRRALGARNPTADGSPSIDVLRGLGQLRLELVVVLESVAIVKAIGESVVLFKRRTGEEARCSSC